MPDEPTSLLPLLISIIVPVLTGILTYRSTLAGVAAQFAINKIEKDAEAAKDYADADATEITNAGNSLSLHNQAIQELLKRDFELIGLNRRVAEQQMQIDNLLIQVETLKEKAVKAEEQLELKNQLIEMLQKELEQEREKYTNLAASVATKIPIEPTQPIPDLSGEQ